MSLSLFLFVCFFHSNEKFLQILLFNLRLCVTQLLQLTNDLIVSVTILYSIFRLRSCGNMTS